jgi:hypothetical protein
VDEAEGCQSQRERDQRHGKGHLLGGLHTGEDQYDGTDGREQGMSWASILRALLLA